MVSFRSAWKSPIIGFSQSASTVIATSYLYKYKYNKNTNTNMFETNTNMFETNLEIVEIPSNWVQPECLVVISTASVYKIYADFKSYKYKSYKYVCKKYKYKF